MPAMSAKEFWLVVLVSLVVGSGMGAIIVWFINMMFTMPMRMPMSM